MRLDPDDARARLAVQGHGVLATLHAVRGPDPVPCVFTLDDDGFVGVPVDTVKPKASNRLQRERNLLDDPRATLLVEHWDPVDWSSLWWVRAELRHVPEPPAGLVGALAERLVARFDQYRGHPFAGMLVLRLGDVTGWAASGGS